MKKREWRENWDRFNFQEFTSKYSTCYFSFTYCYLYIMWWS